MKTVIYNSQREYTRWEALFPETCVLVLMLRADCSLLALKPAHSSPYLPGKGRDGLVIPVDEHILDFLFVRAFKVFNGSSRGGQDRDLLAQHLQGRGYRSE